MDRADSWATYEKLSVFQKPLCLIENCDDGELKACREVLDELKQIKCHFNVIAITGPYRTGKSYLLNYLAGKRQGFPLGSSIRATTKGIWVWCRPHPERFNEVLLLLDTEGLGDAMKGDEENDNWIFALSVLLSSTLVYNCKGVIGQDGLSQLHYVTELTKRMKTKDTSDNEDGTGFFQFFPNFVWVVRDFTLEMTDQEKPISADEYLAICLKLKKGTTPKIDDYNRSRQCIRQFFEDKKCFVFPGPVKGDMKMKELEKLHDSQLQQTFLLEAKNFCHYIYTRSFPKTVKGQPIIGKMFCDLLETYLKVIHSGETPCVENAVKMMAGRVNEEAVKDSLKDYEAQMKKILQKSVTTEDELSKAHLDCCRNALEHFMSMSMLDEKQEYQYQLGEKIRQMYEKICKEWEQDHRGSECENGGQEKKNKQLHAKSESLQRQYAISLKEKLIEEKENSIKEKERRLCQRNEECEQLRGEDRVLLEQQNKMTQEIHQLKIELKQINEGGSSFMKFLRALGSTLTGALQGAAAASSISLVTGNPYILAGAAVVGAVAGGAKGLADGLAGN